MTLLAASLMLAVTSGATAGPAVPAPAQPAAHVLTLEEAMRTGLQSQPQLRQAHANSQAAEARANESRSSLLPQISASASYQRATNNVATRGGTTALGGAASTGTSWDTSNYWNLGASASQLVYDFGQTGGRWDAAKSTAQAQRATEQYTTGQVRLSIRATFFAARANKELVGVARGTLENQQAHLKQTEGFVEVGTRPQIDLATARTAVANAQVQVINAENGYLTSKAQLNQAMGVEGPTDYDIGDEALSEVAGEEQALEPLLDESLKSRADVTALNDQVRAQEATLGAVKGGYYPALGVSTGLSRSGVALDSMVWNWNATATLSWSLFQGGLTRAQQQEAEANVASFEAQLTGLRQQVRLDVEQAWLSVRAAKSSVSAAGEALTNAREQLRLAAARYQTGAGSELERSDAQVALTTAQGQEVQSRYNLSTARAQLLRALGR
jgi:outer membrane protein